MIQERYRQLGRLASPLLIGAVPPLLLAMAVTRFMLNHFFFRAPYLLDSGMLSGLAYHDGLLLPPPKIACNYVDLYYDVYVSPLTSLFSALSYVAPVGRLEWFAVLEGAVYFPIGLAVYLVASRLDPASALRRLPVTLIAALAFSFSGLVLWMIGFPHFEAATPGLTCLVLGALVTGRTRTAWVCLALAASVRQDGGFQVATAVIPLLFLRWRGVAMAPTRRRLIATIAIAIATSVVGILCQKLFFHPFDRLTQAYLGAPLYSHLNAALLAARAHRFLETNQLIYYPFLATCLIAALRRDPQYLLGWAAVVPWFVFSFAAVEEIKASFFAYGSGPFLIGVFWVYLYGAHLAPAHRRLGAGAIEAVFALVCLSSTLGVYRAAPGALRALTEDMAIAHRTDRGAVHAFVEVIHDHRASFGQLRADGSIATLALEYLDPSESWQPGMTGVDALTFHHDTAPGLAILPGLIDNRLDACVHVRHTGIYLCSHDRLPARTFAGLAIDDVPAPFLYMRSTRDNLSVIELGDRGVVFRTAGVLTGFLLGLTRGTYEWTMTVATDEPVALDGAELARLEIHRDDSVLGFAALPKGAREIKLRFDADDGAHMFSYAFESRATTPVIITKTQLRRVTAAATAAP